MTSRRKRRLGLPSFDRQNPWQFSLNQLVYCWGFSGGMSVQIVDRHIEGPYGAPHYSVKTFSGEVWKVPQLHLSTTPIEQRS